MANENSPDIVPVVSNSVEPSEEPVPSFGSALSEFEEQHSHRPQSERGASQIEGTVVSISVDSVFLDIGYKVEGVLSRSAFDKNAEGVAVGDKVLVSVKGRNEDGYYALSRLTIAQPKDWSSLEEAFARKSSIAGTVTGIVKGGLTVDVGVRAFMPASRSGVREAADMEKLIGEEITCRIVKLEAADENIIVDRRIILEEQARSLEQQRYAEVNEGDVIEGQVRSLTSYGAFIDVGGVDGLLHVSDMSWSRVNAPEEILSVGQQLSVKLLKIDRDTRRISLGLKQLQPEPWDSASERYIAGQRITGVVTRLTDFGAFVELEPGIEGLIHVSEMSWVKKVRKPGDLLKEKDTVEVVILALNQSERRISLGLKQALGDPWAEVMQKFPIGSAIEGAVTKLTKFGAFVQLAEGVEGLVHISEISAERHINHPQDVLRAGQLVKVLVLGIDMEKRQIRLSIKQLVPTDLDQYLEEHAVGDIVSGRVVNRSLDQAIVELGEGIHGECRIGTVAEVSENKNEARPDLTALTAMLHARWKGDAKPATSQPESLHIGEVRSFRIVKLHPDTKEIGLEFVSGS